MSVERNKDGSITIRSENSVSVISTTVLRADNREEYQQWVERYAKLVTPCDHTFKEMEQFFLEHCDALPLDNNDRHIQNFKLNIIMCYFKDKLEHQASEFSFDMTDEEIEKWNKDNNDMRKEAMNSSPERFGLNLRGYYLPHTERNKVFYEDNYAADTIDGVANQNHTQKQEIYFFFEETTEQCQCNGGGRSLMQQLTAFRGVSEDDIQKRSPRFLGYISEMREMGKLFFTD